ncbi:MAG TPA: hypothetical protein VGP57_25155, partial [Actinoplanes sp.]|nr:hypothetical protein [Actinoplanes sp.]
RLKAVATHAGGHGPLSRSRTGAPVPVGLATRARLRIQAAVINSALRVAVEHYAFHTNPADRYADRTCRS